ncbi:MAG: hypothetical protein NC548_21325 [Lachnospiraceae bacterium]|nr:hypothetical protein [Lachnospiraceae bacterium]
MYNTNDYNNLIIENWNKTVGKKDKVYILGGLGVSDVYQILVKLNGEIHILNNYYNEDERYFIDILKKSVELSVDKKLKNKIIFETDQNIILADDDVFMSYFAPLNWPGEDCGTFAFHGIVSGSDLNKHRISCVIGDWDFKPICINNIRNNLELFREKIII